MQLHLVITLVGGYAREDQSHASVIGAYTDPEVARVVRLCCGSQASVQIIEVDAIPLGVREFARNLSLKLPE